MILLLSLAKIARIDRREQRISNLAITKLLVWRIFFLVFECISNPHLRTEQIQFALLGFLIVGGLFFLCYCVIKNGLGAGDVKLLATVGAYLGWERTLEAAFVSVCYAMVYSVLKMCCCNRKITLEMAFAPFIFWGTVTVFLFCQLP